MSCSCRCHVFRFISFEVIFMLCCFLSRRLHVVFMSFHFFWCYFHITLCRLHVVGTRPKYIFLAKGGWVGWGGDINIHVPCLHTWMDATLLLRHWAWVGWGGILTFMYLAYIRGCYAAATVLGMGGVGGDVNVHVPCLHTWMLRCCYVTGHGWGGGDINVHVPCLHTWTCAAATSLGMGGVGGDINVHVPCLHTWMLRCCYVTGHGWGGGGY